MFWNSERLRTCYRHGLNLSRYGSRNVAVTLGFFLCSKLCAVSYDAIQYEIILHISGMIKLETSSKSELIKDAPYLMNELWGAYYEYFSMSFSTLFFPIAS